MVVNEKREGAQIIQFPLNARIKARHQEMAEAMDARMDEALDPAWYHGEAMREPDAAAKPKH